MPVYVCRWPNGDCSVVLARNKEDVVVKLDEVSNAEGCPIARLQEFQAHFHLTDEGDLELESFGEETEAGLAEFCYPLLEQVQVQVGAEREASGAAEFTPEQQERLRDAVRQERDRVIPAAVKEPATELGRKIKKQMGAPTAVVDRMIRREGNQILRELKPPWKPH